jgi:hypothetical protein
MEVSMRRHVIFHGAVFSILAVLGTKYSAQAQPPEKEKLLGVVYDISGLLAKYDTGGLLGKPQVARAQNGLAEIIELIMSTVRPDVWRAQDSAHAIFELHGKKLEIHTTQQNHEEIVDLLAALERLTEVAVVVDCGLYEVERGIYEKEIAPRLAKLPGAAPALPVANDLDQKLQKATKLLKGGKTKMGSGQDGLFFAVHRAVPYDAPGPGATTPALAFPGIALHGKFIVSADRRFVRMTLVQKTTDLLRVAKEPFFDVKQMKRIELAVPELQESTVTASVTAGDGGLVLLPVRAPVPGLRVRPDHMPVILLRPAIHIPEEER